MYKVLIIDDEEPLREAIKILGDWEGLQVGEVLEATNGVTGLEMLKKQRPDLVMVDMKMPEMNGVEFLRVVENDYPELLTIVISGYNDFEFTRQAIHSKVVDYLLKPINRHDLNEALRKAIDILDAKRQTHSELITKNIAFNMSLPKLKEKIYLSIIGRGFKKQSNQAFLPLIGADKEDNRFGALVLKILNMQQVRDNRFNRDTELLYFAVANVINEVALDDIICFSFPNPKQDGEIIAIFTMQGGYPEDHAFRADYLIKKVGHTLSDLFGIVSAAGVGQVYDEVSRLADSYEEARSSILAIDLLKMRGVTVFGAKGNSKSPEVLSFTSRMPILRSALESGNTNHARVVFAEFTKKIKEADSFTIGEAERMLRDIIVLFNDMALDLGVPSDKLPVSGSHSSLQAAGLSGDFSTTDEYEQLLYRILEYYSEQIRQSMAVNRPFNIQDIKDYIDQHYFEDIKISMFTEKYFLSREYLMKLFKQQFGYGIHEYMQKVRMDKACVLLDDPTLKIQDISEMLGYKDKNYFSKAYRNYYGESPSEYRAKREADKK
ncbi:response regulator transcription factor [Paenibacillus bouchesdurhonensis]|uniref:response regulator transcription factor n=1 Tax=Paenibacillus bouchesdurhonensis TaxID=1870990 RepID=UPI000DA61C94|nr:response regulator [Paenibacillus bouchesdurhonensis]